MTRPFAKGLLANGLALALLFALLGCSASGGKAKVKGKVIFNKKPLPAGQVAFVGSGNSVMAEIQSDGSYEIVNPPLGDVTITVKTMPFGEMMGRGGPAPPPGVGPTKPPEGSGKEPGEPSAKPGKFVRIPAKYADPAQSGLKFTVKKGENEHDIELTP